jgi:hypothetical protein
MPEKRSSTFTFQRFYLGLPHEHQNDEQPNGNSAQHVAKKDLVVGHFAVPPMAFIGSPTMSTLTANAGRRTGLRLRR